MTVVRLTELEQIDAAGVHWRPLRQALGVTAFKTNAYSADAGERLIERHTEAGSGQQEMYVLVAGAATFEHGEEEVEVMPGTVVFFDDPSAQRGAVATADGTLVVAVGGMPGTAGPVSAWEHRMSAQPFIDAGDPAGAYDRAAVALADHPDDGGLHYDLACFAALDGRRDQALEHLRTAFRQRPESREWAEDDTDLDSVRDAI